MKYTLHTQLPTVSTIPPTPSPFCYRKTVPLPFPPPGACPPPALPFQPSRSASGGTVEPSMAAVGGSSPAYFGKITSNQHYWLSHNCQNTHTHIHTIWLNITIKHYSFGIEQAKIVRWPANMMIFPLEMSFFLRARIVHHLVVVPGWKFWKSPSSPKCTFRWVIHVLRSLDLSLPLDLEGKLAWSLHFDITGPRPKQATDHGDSTLVATPSRNVKIWSPWIPIHPYVIP